MTSLACKPGPKGPDLDLVVNDPRAEMAHARVLFTSFDFDTSENWALLVDGAGDIQWSLEGTVESRIFRAKPSQDGRDVLYASNDPKELSDIGVIVRHPLDNSPPIVTTAPFIHHDFLEITLDGGPGYAYLEHNFTEAPLGRLGTVPVAADAIRSIPEGGDTRGDVRFDLLGDYAFEPWWACDHMELGRRIEGYHEWAHSNSLIDSPQTGTWFVMLRYLDTLLEVDPATGAVLAQINGRDATVTSASEDSAFTHSHMSHLLDPQQDERIHLLVFDNGQDHDAPFETSRVVEIAFDPTANTIESIWELSDPQGEHTLFLGDARRLPGGNTLIAWGQKGRIEEYTPRGELLWQLDVGMAVGRIHFW